MLRKTITALALFALASILPAQAKGSGITLGSAGGASETWNSNALIHVFYGEIRSGTRRSPWVMEIMPPGFVRKKVHAVCFAGLDAPGGVLANSTISPPIFWSYLGPVSDGEIYFHINNSYTLPKLPKLYFQVYWSHDAMRTWNRSGACWIKVK